MGQACTFHLGKAKPKTLNKSLLWLSTDHLHFLASSSESLTMTHPESKIGVFQENLWQYDVAEFFLSRANRETYLEINLNADGAWWSRLFVSPRCRAPFDAPIPGVTVNARRTPHSWFAHLRIPRPWLESHHLLEPGCALNTTFIENSPDQLFLSSADLGPGEPDFHQPAEFPQAKFTPLA